MCISSSIANFREKLLKRMQLEEWSIFTLFEPTIFFGLYHIGDYIRFLLHRGEKRVFWCGSDILNLQRSLWKILIHKAKARHFCENEVEEVALLKLGIKAEICPMIFDDPNKYHPCLKKEQIVRGFATTKAAKKPMA